MTKPGYTHIIVPTELHAQLKVLAKEDRVSIAQKIAHLVNVVGDSSINTKPHSINTTCQKSYNLSHNYASNDKISSENSQNAFSLSTGSLFAKRENVVVARKRLELLSRAPEAPMLGHYTTGLQIHVSNRT